MINMISLCHEVIMNYQTLVYSTSTNPEVSGRSCKIGRTIECLVTRCISFSIHERATITSLAQCKFETKWRALITRHPQGCCCPPFRERYLRFQRFPKTLQDQDLIENVTGYLVKTRVSLSARDTSHNMMHTSNHKRLSLKLKVLTSVLERIPEHVMHQAIWFSENR